MKERTQEKMVLYWRVAGVTLVGGGEPWVKPIATEGESVAGLMLGNEDVPQIFFLFSFSLPWRGEEELVAPEEGDKGLWGLGIGYARRA